MASKRNVFNFYSFRLGIFLPIHYSAHSYEVKTHFFVAISFEAFNIIDNLLAHIHLRVSFSCQTDSNY